MKCKCGDFYTESTLYMYSIRRVIMYNCHLAWWSGAIQGCYSVTSTERSFTPRSKKRLETSKHPLNRDSHIFLFESIEGWTKKHDKTSKQTSDHQTNQYTIEAEAYIIYHEASVTSYVYEIRPKMCCTFSFWNCLTSGFPPTSWEFTLALSHLFYDNFSVFTRK